MSVRDFPTKTEQAILDEVVEGGEVSIPSTQRRRWAAAKRLILRGLVSHVANKTTFIYKRSSGTCTRQNSIVVGRIDHAKHLTMSAGPK